MTITVSKLDKTTIQVAKEHPVKVDVSKYDLNFLLKQKTAIESDLEKYTKARRAEIDEVDMLLAECERLGIKPKKADNEEIA